MNAVFSTLGVVVTLRGERVFVCNVSHSSIKDAYFCLGSVTTGYNINTFLNHVAGLPGGVISSAGELSFEDTEISHFQPAPL